MTVIIIYFLGKIIAYGMRRTQSLTSPLTMTIHAIAVRLKWRPIA